MTDSQIEHAARAYCSITGQDPDEVVWGSDPHHPTLARAVSCWQLAAGRIRDRLILDEAIQYGRSQPEEGPSHD